MQPTYTLAELAEAQQAHEIYAYSLGDDATKLACLRAIYSRKLAELNTVLALFDETTPDLILRAVDGRQVALRLPGNEIGDLLNVLHQILSDGMRGTEAEIVQHLQQMADDEEVARAYPEKNNSPRLTMRAPILALCAPGNSVMFLAGGEWERRTEAAEALERQEQQRYNNDHGYGSEILWHPLFAAGYVRLVSDMPLAEIASYHARQLADWCNQGRPLDATDYTYIADALREGLASNPTELAALRLRRALTWVEQAISYPPALVDSASIPAKAAGPKLAA